MTIDLEEFERLLRRRREEILHTTELREQAAQPVELDQSRVGRLSRMDDLQSQAISVAAKERVRLELGRIGQALDRMRNGEYGHCLECGEAISVGRLRIEPAAPHCIDCARKRENV
jgi:DnaK suppressor protein